MLTYLIILFVVLVLGSLLCWKECVANCSEGAAGFFSFICYLCALVWIIFPFWGYMSHVKDVGTVLGQQYIITVHEERVQRLQTNLTAIVGTNMDIAILNQDAPIAKLVESISDAEAGLAKAKLPKAESLRQIERRKAGPLKFIVDWYGPY